MRGAGPLAVDDFVKVIGRRNIGWFHSHPVRATNNGAALLFPANAQLAFLRFSNWIIGLSY